MSNMTAWEYRREIRMFRGELTNTAQPAGLRTLKGEGFQWYKVKAEPTVSLYLDLSNLYLKAFRNAHGYYKFYHEANPRSRGGTIIDATELQFLESYNGNAGRYGIGLPEGNRILFRFKACDNSFEDISGKGRSVSFSSDIIFNRSVS